MVLLQKSDWLIWKSQILEVELDGEAFGEIMSKLDICL